MKKLVLIAALALTPVMANADANSDIMARQDVMKAIGAAAKAGDFAKLAEVTDPAITVAAFMPNTDGQGDVKTTATGAIWSDFDTFKGILMEMNTLAAAGDPAVFGTCKACHKDYRAK